MSTLTNEVACTWLRSRNDFPRFEVLRHTYCVEPLWQYIERLGPRNRVFIEIDYAEQLYTMKIAWCNYRRTFSDLDFSV